MDGGQAVAQEFQRLTAQLSSQLAGLNKPNDGAAAASILKEQGKTAVAIQKETNSSIVVSESEKNKQIEAMWAQRQAQISAALTKESQVVAAYAAREVQTTRQSQTQIAAAHQQRERQVEAIAKQGESAWARHEAAKLSATRQAEKQGEAIVAQTNVAKEQSNKRTETTRRQQTREALLDIARLERERLQIITQNARAVEGLAKREADSRIREGRRAANALLASLRDLQREEARIRAQLTQRASSGTNAFLAGAAGGITALVGVSVITEIRQAGAAWLDYSNKLETTRIAFTTMLGSAQLANDHLKELQEFALKTPFQFGELIDASQRMQALGFSAQQVIPLLSDVGNAVAAAGGGSERLDRVVLALSQIQSKGKVATQELNQLAESGIPAFRILQETLNKSGAEVRKLVEEGQISSKVFLDAFQKFSQQNFGGLMEAQSKTFSGAMSNIKDALLQTSSTAFAPLFEKLTQTALHFSQASQSSDDFKRKLETVGTVSATIWDGAVEAIIAFRDAFRLMTAAISGQITVLIEGFRAIGHATAALFFESFAVAKLAQKDFAGAAKAHEIAQDEMRQATDSAKKSIVAQGEALRTVIKIYKEAEERADALRKAQAKVSVDVGVGDGILRKKRTETEDDLEKKTKGPDPAATAKRLAELRLQDTLVGLAAEEDALKRSLVRRELEFQQYVLELEVLENRRHQQVISGLIEEAQAAAQLRKGNLRQIAEQEIANKRRQEEVRHKNETNKLTDETEEYKRKQFGATTEVLRATTDAQLRIAAISDEQRITAITSLAEARVKTEEEAAREILKIRLAAIDREKDQLEADVKATDS
ncbi:MAG TPA: tape measure protein, partial [Polyangiaceae bacterium]|nr:tape measure protein [Polyangiaceae bacterium]